MLFPLPLFQTYIRASIGIQKASKNVYFPLSALTAFRFSPDEDNALRRIDKLRESYLGRHETVAIRDYGSGRKRFPFPPSHGSKDGQRSIAEIYKVSAVPRHWGYFLFRLVRDLNPRLVLELGTNLGVSACYILSALVMNGDGGRLVSIEGDPTLSSIARDSLRHISESHVEVVTGRFSDVLPHVLARNGSIDLAFIDGHHEERAMREYYTQLLPSLSKSACVVFDDIYPWNRGLRRAWKAIRTERADSVSVDLAKFGILFPFGFK